MSIETSPTASDNQDLRALRPLVCVQGLGYVGTAMALAIASAREDKTPAFDVVGVELPGARGNEIVDALNWGVSPIESSDPKMKGALTEPARPET